MTRNKKRRELEKKKRVRDGDGESERKQRSLLEWYSTHVRGKEGEPRAREKIRSKKEAQEEQHEQTVVARKSERESVCLREMPHKRRGKKEKASTNRGKKKTNVERRMDVAEEERIKLSRAPPYFFLL